MIFVLLSVMVFLPTGCAKYWYQEGKTFEECRQARQDCFDELKKRTSFTSATVDYEIKFMNQCMQEKGYREVSAKELPLDARRQEPETSLHWRTRGIAGSLSPR